MTKRTTPYNEIREATKSQTVQMSVEDLVKLPHACAWKGCRENYTGDQPEDWVNILAWSGQPDAHRAVIDIVFDQRCYRDACLCPTHAQAFFDQLCPLPPRGN